MQRGTEASRNADLNLMGYRWCNRKVASYNFLACRVGVGANRTRRPEVNAHDTVNGASL